MDGMKAEILNDLMVYFEQTDEVVRPEVIKQCINQGIDIVRNKRKYPSDYSEDAIVSDMIGFRSAITDVARFYYLTIGAEYQAQHTENNTNRTFLTVDTILKPYDIMPISKLL